MSDTPPAPAPSQAEADAFKHAAHGTDETKVPPVNVDIPAITGTPAIGSALACTMGNWQGEPTSYRYEWKIGGSRIAIGAEYMVQESDAGQDIACTVTACSPYGETSAPPSTPVTIPAGAPAGTAAKEVKPAANTKAGYTTR